MINNGWILRCVICCYHYSCIALILNLITHRSNCNPKPDNELAPPSNLNFLSSASSQCNFGVEMATHLKLGVVAVLDRQNAIAVLTSEIQSAFRIGNSTS